MGAYRGRLPARGEEPHHGHENEEEEKYRKGYPIDLIGHDGAFQQLGLQNLLGFVLGTLSKYQPDQQGTDRYPRQLVPIEKGNPNSAGSRKL